MLKCNFTVLYITAYQILYNLIIYNEETYKISDVTDYPSRHGVIKVICSSRNR